MSQERVLVFYKNPSIASFLSFLYMGAGQIYNGEKRKGALFIAIYTVSIFMTLFAIGFLTTPVLWIWGIIDAGRSANRKNRALASRLTEDEPVPDMNRRVAAR